MLPLAVFGIGVAYGAGWTLGTLGAFKVLSAINKKLEEKQLINSMEDDMIAVIQDYKLIGGFTSVDAAIDSHPILKKHRKEAKEALNEKHVYRINENGQYVVAARKRARR